MVSSRAMSFGPQHMWRLRAHCTYAHLSLPSLHPRTHTRARMAHSRREGAIEQGSRGGREDRCSGSRVVLECHRCSARLSGRLCADPPTGCSRACKSTRGHVCDSCAQPLACSTARKVPHLSPPPRVEHSSTCPPHHACKNVAGGHAYQTMGRRKGRTQKCRHKAHGRHAQGSSGNAGE